LRRPRRLAASTPSASPIHPGPPRLSDVPRTVEQPPSLPEVGATHAPVASQIVGATQSATEMHLGRQVPLVSHLYGAQSFFVPSMLVAV
jgi:hypothetical protein